MLSFKLFLKMFHICDIILPSISPCVPTSHTFTTLFNPKLIGNDFWNTSVLNDFVFVTKRSKLDLPCSLILLCSPNGQLRKGNFHFGLLISDESESFEAIVETTSIKWFVLGESKIYFICPYCPVGKRRMDLCTNQASCNAFSRKSLIGIRGISDIKEDLQGVGVYTVNIDYRKQLREPRNSPHNPLNGCNDQANSYFNYRGILKEFWSIEASHCVMLYLTLMRNLTNSRNLTSTFNFVEHGTAHRRSVELTSKGLEFHMLSDLEVVDAVDYMLLARKDILGEVTLTFTESFDTWTWIYFLLSLLVVSSALFLSYAKVSETKLAWTYFPFLLLWAFSLALGQTFEREQDQLRKASRVSAGIILLWGTVLVVVSNAYTESIYRTLIVQPFPQFPKSFHDVTNNTDLGLYSVAFLDPRRTEDMLERLPFHIIQKRRFVAIADFIQDKLWLRGNASTVLFNFDEKSNERWFGGRPFLFHTIPTTFALLYSSDIKHAIWAINEATKMFYQKRNPDYRLWHEIEAWFTSKNFVLELVPRLCRSTRSSGLFGYWQRRYNRKQDNLVRTITLTNYKLLSDNTERGGESGSKAKPLGWPALKTGFFISAIGLFISILVFFVEKVSRFNTSVTRWEYIR